ncbi:hypothetical protein Tco_0443945, partial [Tanacetum coccineum]
LKTKLLCAKGKSPIDEPADLKVENKRLKKDIASIRELSDLVESS